jgi:hypothetical protein
LGLVDDVTPTRARADEPATLPGPWRPFVRGVGVLEEAAEGGVRLVLAGATQRAYSDAQLDDYQARPPGAMPWRAPAVMTVRARCSHGPGRLRGTAGFGFWNDPGPGGRGRSALPRAVWFFYASPPSDLRLARDVPGHGWKAAMIDAVGWRTVALLPLGLACLPLMWSPAGYRRLWPFFQRALRVAEAPLAVDPTAWHSYRIEWRPAGARLLVDDRVVLESDRPPRGRLGAVLWLDNRYAVVTPQGRLRWGLLEVPERQWLELGSLSVQDGE